MCKNIVVLFFLGSIVSVGAQNIFRTACQGNIKRLDSMLTETSINTKDFRGRSLIHWAVGCKQNEVFDFLVQKGIDALSEDNQKKTPLHTAIYYDNQMHFDLLVGLQQNKRWKKQYGASLLESAVLNKNKMFVEKLVDTGININSKNDRGSTPLEISMRIGTQDITEFLIAKGADKNLVRSYTLKGQYMGQDNPGTTPRMFAPNFVSTEEEEFGSVFNKAGTAFYYGAHINGKSEIRYSQLVDSSWSKPTTILSHDQYGYNDPFLSNDENRLYYISKRALDGIGEPKDVDIWYSERNENGWSEPINAGTHVNTLGDEYYISFTKNGTLYFSSDGHSDKDVDSKHDIYYSEFKEGQFQKPVKLGPAINTDAYEADVFIAPDESYIIFCSTREGGHGQGDLYISFKNANGWSEAVNMGSPINSDNYEYCPFVTKDGKYLLYTSNQDIFWVSTEVLVNFRK